MPAGHATQDAAPGADCHVPAAQSVHDVAPVAFCVDRPAVHGKHGWKPAAEKLPRSHGMPLAYSASNPLLCVSPSDMKRTSMTLLVDIRAAGVAEPENRSKRVAPVLGPS